MTYMPRGSLRETQSDAYHERQPGLRDSATQRSNGIALGEYPKYAFQACDLNRSSSSPRMLITVGDLADIVAAAGLEALQTPVSTFRMVHF